MSIYLKSCCIIVVRTSDRLLNYCDKNANSLKSLHFPLKNNEVFVVALLFYVLLC